MMIESLRVSLQDRGGDRCGRFKNEGKLSEPEFIWYNDRFWAKTTSIYCHLLRTADQLDDPLAP